MKFIRIDDMELNTPYLFYNRKFNYVGVGIFKDLDQLDSLQYTEFIGMYSDVTDSDGIICNIINENDYILALKDDIIFELTTDEFNNHVLCEII